MAPRSRRAPAKDGDTTDKPATSTRQRDEASSATGDDTIAEASAIAQENAPAAKPRRRRSAGVTLDTDEERFSDQPEAEEEPSKPDRKTQAASTKSTPRKKPWEREHGEKVVVNAVRIPVSLRDRIDGVEDYLQTHDPEEIAEWLQPAVGSQSNLLSFALHRLVTQVEDELNQGKPLPVLIRRKRKP